MKTHRIYIALLCLSLFVLLNGCGIFSIHPLFHEKDLIVNTKLIGTWKDASDENSLIKIDTTADSKYLFTRIDAGDTTDFEMGLLQLQGQYFIDLFPMEKCGVFQGEDCDMMELLFKNYIPVHTFMKIEIGNGDFNLIGFDNERLIKLFHENRIRLAHETDKEDKDAYVVITASTDDLQKFISRYATEKEAFSETMKYTKVKS